MDDLKTQAILRLLEIGKRNREIARLKLEIKHISKELDQILNQLEPECKELTENVTYYETLN